MKIKGLNRKKEQWKQVVDLIQNNIQKFNKIKYQRNKRQGDNEPIIPTKYIPNLNNLNRK